MNEQLSGGAFANPVRKGDTVERAAAPANVHALLQHFEQVGFTMAPRFLETSDAGKRDVLSFIEGETGYPPLTDMQRSDETLVNVVTSIRAVHDATQGFVAPSPGEWGGYEVAVPARTDCIGHNDLAPWNIVFDGTRVAGLIDWDTARPSNRAWDLAYAAHQFVPFHPPANMTGFGWEQEPNRPARLRLLADTYGHGIEPSQLLDLIVVRLTSLAAYMEQEIRANNPAFELHRVGNHPAGYRKAAQFILDSRQALLT